LQSYKDVKIAQEVVKLLPQMTGDVREVAESLLVSRQEWSQQFIAAVHDKRIPAKSIPLPTIRKLLLHKDQRIAFLVKEIWGDVKGATTEQMRKDIDRLAGVVGNGKGDPYPGKKLYTAKCANCHTLHAHLLLHIINPNAEIREGYESSIVNTESGRTLTGIVMEKDARVVVLRSAEGQRIVLRKDDIELMSVSGISLMPEGLLDGMSEQDVRDLFAYLRSGQPLNERK
jgi:putative heme-binding domain-containing protein